VNPTDCTLPRQAKPIKSAVDDSADEPSPSVCTDERCLDDRRLEESFPPIEWDDPSWFLSPVEHNGLMADSDFWEPGPWLPAGSLFYLAGHLLRPLVETDQGDDAPPARRRRARR
jgi:hypothetical protein